MAVISEQLLTVCASLTLSKPINKTSPARESVTIQSGHGTCRAAPRIELKGVAHKWTSARVPASLSAQPLQLSPPTCECGILSCHNCDASTARRDNKR